MKAWIHKYIDDQLATRIADKDFRIKLCEKYIFYFGLIYFPHYFTHEPAEFHLDMCKDLNYKGFRYLMWIMYRGSAKTAWAKIKLIHNIVYKKKMFNLYACFDQRKASARLFDVAIQLQTNKQLIEDFGQLFFDESLNSERKSQKKSIDEFICTNKVKVQAASTKTSVQGLNYDSYRPDFWIIDDFETWDTITSDVKTKSVIDWLDGELMGGEDVDTEILFLCNRLSKFGVVKHLEARAINNIDFKVRDISIETDGKFAWPSRFVATDMQAKDINQHIVNTKQLVISLESKKRNTSLAKFFANYYNKPTNPEASIIKEEWIKDNYYDVLPNFIDMDVYIAVDPAGGEEQTADDTAICVMGRHRISGTLYVIAMYNEKISISDQLKRVPEIYKMWSMAKYLGVEVVYNQRALYNLLDQLSGGIEPIYLPLISINPRGKDKVTRLQHFEPIIRAGKVKFNQYHVAFHDQLIIFPDPKEHDDMVDAFIYGLQMATEGTPISDDYDIDVELAKMGTIAGNIIENKF